ncbi:MAG: ammonium transporter [Cardiobacteriaceae bacterium]|nr:ammonium transporter [Cardiobacteriaceae bacterium]
MNTEIIELKYCLDSLYLLLTGALVFWMAAGFTMLESGMVRAKNTTEILTKNIGLFCIATICYFLFGYSLQYGKNPLNSFLPSFNFELSIQDTQLADLTNTDKSNSYSKLSFFFFQIVFVATAMSVVSGAIAERMKLWSFFIFAIIMTSFIYPVQGYWKWGGGFLDKLGFIDYAGSGVVHLCGASAALAAVLLLGPRQGKYSQQGKINAIVGANMPLVALGTWILWLGWLGFNGGSQLITSTLTDANTVAKVFCNTTISAAAAGISASITAKTIIKKIDFTMLCNGILAGLVAITANPDSPTLLQAMFIGLIAGLLVVFSVLCLDKLKLDDPVGAISVHGTCAIWGLIAVIFTQENKLLAQIIGIFTIFTFVFISSFIVLFILKKTVGIRVEDFVEHDGIDIHECGIEAYPEFVKI